MFVRFCSQMILTCRLAIKNEIFWFICLFVYLILSLTRKYRRKNLIWQYFNNYCIIINIIISLNHRFIFSFKYIDLDWLDDKYYSLIIMFSYIYSYCDMTQRTNRELNRHTMTCEVKLNTKRRKIFKRIVTISKEINVENARKDFTIDDIQNCRILLTGEKNELLLSLSTKSRWEIHLII
jgi:hypothetical protein